MFAHFSLPDVPDVARRTVSSVMVLGIALLVAAVVFGKPLFGVGGCIGLALGIFNMRMVGNSVAKVSAADPENKRRPLALNAVGRLGVVTVVVLGLLFVAFSLGFGVLAGIAIFQAVFLVNVARSMAKPGPMTSVDDVITANVVEGTSGAGPAIAPAPTSSDEPTGGA